MWSSFCLLALISFGKQDGADGSAFLVPASGLSDLVGVTENASDSALRSEVAEIRFSHS